MKNRDIYLIFAIIFLIIFAIISLYFIIDLCLITERRTYFELFNKELYKTPILSSEQVKAPKTKKYLDQVEHGYKNAKTKRVVIASLCRNVKKSIELTRTRLEKIGEAFGDYRIILFENDSTDGTRKALIEWTKKNNRVILLDCCEFGPCDCKLKYKHGYDLGALSKSRMEKMAFYRNQYLDYTKKHFSDFDYLLVYDFDLNGGIYLDGLISNFDPRLDWDMVCATGLMSIPHTSGFFQPIIYDSLAFVSIDDKTLKLYKLYKHLEKLNKTSSKIGDNLILIKSGFNGLAIYKMDSIKDQKYNSQTRCEHIDFHLSMIEKGFDKIFISPNMIIYCILQGPEIDKSIFIKFIKGTL